MSDKPTTPKPRTELGSKQAIRCLILPWQYGETPEEKAATKSQLGAREIFNRADLQACVQEMSENLMSEALAAGKKDLERQDYDRALAAFGKTVRKLVESGGKSAEEVAAGLKAMGCGPPKPPEGEPGLEPYVVTISFSGDPREPGDEYEAQCWVEAGGESVGSGSNMSDCPEDANLGRDLGFVYDLPKRLKEAHQAGLGGRPFELVEKPNDAD